MAAVLVTLAQAKGHLRITDADHDADVQLKLDQAEAIVRDWCNSTAHWRPIVATWESAATAPLAVQSAILLVLEHLYENRGQDMQTAAALWTAVERLIGPHKDPVLV